MREQVFVHMSALSPQSGLKFHAHYIITDSNHRLNMAASSIADIIGLRHLLALYPNMISR